MTRVLICDDKTSRIPQWEALVKSHLPEVETLSFSGSDLAELFRQLTALEQEVRAGEVGTAAPADTPLAVAQSTDIALLDSDLSPSPTDLALITSNDERTRVALTLRHGYGDELARLLRSYTDAGVTLVVNQFRTRAGLGRSFDTTLMREARTFADLHASDAELSDTSLWDVLPAPDGTFRPWYRESVHRLLPTVESAHTAVTGHLNTPVLELLDLDPDRFAAAQLDPLTADDPSKTTVREFAESPSGLKYPLGRDDGAIARMAASVMRRWLARAVVPGQNVLLDAPHLVERYGARLWGEGLEDAQGLAPTLTWDDAAGLPGAEALHVAARAFSPRPLYDAEAVRRLLRTGSRDGAAPTVTHVFAEDTSRFVSVSDAESFPSDVPGPQQRRWIEHLDEVLYVPGTRLHL